MRLPLFLSALILLSQPFSAFAAGELLTDVYGDSVTAFSSFNLLSPLNAAGAPDDAYAEYRAADTYITIDMGEGEEGMGDLIMTIRSFAFGASAYVTFYDADMAVLATGGNIFSSGATTDVVTYHGEEKYRFVRIASPSSKQWSLDAIQATQVETPPSPDAPPEPCGCVLTAEIPYGNEASGAVEAGTLVKTSLSSSVYLVGADGMRHAFPNEPVFTSWGYDFSDVQTISAADMASYQLGKNVTVRPGTWLVKIPMNPKVYAVGEHGTLHWIRTEAQAKVFYGADWSERVLDVSEVFWKNYTEGAEGTGDYVSGTIFNDSETYYIQTEDGARTLFTTQPELLRVHYGFAVDRSPSEEEKVAADQENDDLVSFYHPF